MDDNKLGPKSGFIPEVTAGLKEAHDMVMKKYKTKINKVKELEVSYFCF